MTQDEIDKINGLLPHFKFSTPHGWIFGLAPTGLTGTHVAIVDVENDYAHIENVDVDLVRINPGEVLNMVKRNLDRGYRRGEEAGRYEVRSAMLTALGISDVIHHAREDMKRAEQREREDYHPQGRR